MSNNAHLNVSAVTRADGMRTEITTPPRGDEPGTSIQADVPVADGGTNSSASPSQLFIASLSACKSMTAMVYAKHKGFALEHAEVTTRYVDENGEIRLESEVQLHGDLTDDQRERILKVMEKCHVQQMIEAAPKVVSRLTDTVTG